ncbi:unnamed protein product [Ilex paraguariensis]|uniref:Uncharacterized protein n=1 Tax=Ilex paraguariensis TaxID=185542 RepID=A0ABC8TIW0_9AQUA
MAEPPSLSPAVKESMLLKGAFAVGGIMSTLVIYGILQVHFSDLEVSVPELVFCFVDFICSSLKFSIKCALVRNLRSLLHVLAGTSVEKLA